MASGVGLLAHYLLTNFIMGLHQYAYVGVHNDAKPESDYKFVWRNHYKLNNFMEDIYFDRVDMDIDNFNCGELELFEEDIARLTILVSIGVLPASLLGCDDEDEVAEEERDQDLEFCAWAKRQFQEGQRVFYSCWW